MQSTPSLHQAKQLLEPHPDVLGLALTGSQARAGMATEFSDTDLIVFVSDDCTISLPTVDGIDFALYRMSEAATPALHSSDFDAWYNRAAFLHARTLFERQTGQVDEWIERQSTLTGDESKQVIAHHLDGYLNLAIRALKSQRDGQSFGSALDSVEAIGWALTTIFALEQRIRPFNKYLRWELDNYPLVASELQAETLLSLLRSIVEGKVDKHRDVFWQIAPIIEREGFTSVVSAWGDDLDLIAR